MKMRARTGLILTSLMLCASSMADPSSGNWLQLHRLNQANRQELQRIQRAYTDQKRPPVAQQRNTRERLNQQQRLEQRSLQESQQRERLISEQRRRVLSGSRPQRVESLFQQQRFRQAQEQQLQRFDMQQQLRILQR